MIYNVSFLKQRELRTTLKFKYDFPEKSTLTCVFKQNSNLPKIDKKYVDLICNDIIFILRPCEGEKNKCFWTCIICVSDNSIPAWVQNMVCAKTVSTGMDIYYD